jgi:phage-related protein
LLGKTRSGLGATRGLFAPEVYGSFAIDGVGPAPLWYISHRAAAVQLPTMKPCEFIGSSLDDISQMPEAVKRVFGFAIRTAQRGEKHPDAKALSGFGAASVLEVVENFEGDTYRAVYTVKFPGIIYVLHVFKKKSTKGRKTPKPDIDLIRSRLRAAERDYAAKMKEKLV